MPRRILVGVVVSTKADKTALVRVDRTYLHPLLKKAVRRSRKFSAHDATNSAQDGQEVSIRECAPISRTKRWEIVSGAEAGSDKGESA